MQGKQDGGAHAAFAGVDTHKDSHTLALLDALGRCLGTWEFPSDRAGCERLADAIGDTSVAVGVEGTRSYGAGLVEVLAERGFEPQEVIRPRREQRRRGKSDAIDAVAAARNVSSGRALPVKSLAGPVGEIAALMVAREQAVGHASRLSNCVQSMLVSAPVGVRERHSGASPAETMAALASSDSADGLGTALRGLARSWEGSVELADGLRSRIAQLVAEACPALLGAPCVGPIAAARLLVAAGANPERMRSEAAFSMLCGTSPIPASTGRSSGRHRLNRGGDRQANRGIHEIARARMAHDGRTQAYIARKVSEGMSKKEAIRCLCRYIAREAYRLMTGPQEPACEQSRLAERRKAAGLTQVQAAQGAGITRSKVARMERMVEYDTASLEKYDAYLSKAEKGLDNI